MEKQVIGLLKIHICNHYTFYHWGTIGFCFADRYVGIESLHGKILISLVFTTIIICIERFIILTVGKLGWMGFIRGLLAF